MNAKDRLDACLDEKVSDFNRAVREDTLIVPQQDCQFKFTTDTGIYCASNSDFSLPCACSNLLDGCCTASDKCGLGEGDCDSDDQCGSDLVCNNNLDNCQSEFGWVNGDSGYDCCQHKDPNDPVAVAPSNPRCGDANCQCTEEDVASTIEDSGAICQSSTDSGCKFIQTYTMSVPSNPCEDTIQAIENESELIFRTPEDRADTLADIDLAIQCLYYSYFVYDFGESCDSLVDQVARNDCNSACGNGVKSYFLTENDSEFGPVVFEIDTSSATDVPIESSGSYFRYRIPAILPSLEDRLSGADSGRFFFDNLDVETDSTAANFVVDIFTEYMNCAVSKVSEQAET